MSEQERNAEIRTEAIREYLTDIALRVFIARMTDANLVRSIIADMKAYGVPVTALELSGFIYEESEKQAS